MLRLLADENFDTAIVRGVLQANSELDIVLAQDVGLRSVPDDLVLGWAARENRIVMTHDIKTLVPLAYVRVAAGDAMPGVIAVRWGTTVGRAVEHFLIVVGASRPDEFVNQVVRLPYSTPGRLSQSRYGDPP